MGNPFMRSLFKPILNTASRSAYKMRNSAQELGKAARDSGAKIYDSPYYKAYMEAAMGKAGPTTFGPFTGGKRIKQITALGTPIYAYDKLSDLTNLPFRTTTPEKEEEKVIEDDKSILIEEPETREEEKVDSETELKEDVLATSEDTSNTRTTDTALVEQNNLYSGLIENDSLRRIEGYKDVIKQIMGSGDESQNMQSMAMLMQLGSALMSGKSLDSGLQGFLDIVGQAGMQTAPTLFQMGVEKGKADREIGAAALNMYMSELDKANDRSGPFTIVYENLYKTDGNNELVYNNNGDPIVTKKRRVGQYFRKSPEVMNYMDLNAGVGYDRFTFVDTSATEAGMQASGWGSGTSAQMGGEAAKDAQIKYANYLKRGLNTMADFIMPLIIDQRQNLLGTWGEIARLGAPKKAFLDAITQGLFTSAGGEKNFNEKFNAIQKDTLDAMQKDNYLVFRTPNQTQIIDGKEVGFFVDHKNEYGFNANPTYSSDGKTLLDPGEAAWIPTRKGVEMLLDNPNLSALKTFETTLGLMLARDRQPTGRMLADVLRNSFAQTKMTGLGSDLATSPQQVIENYVYIYNTLYDNMTAAYNSAGQTDNEAEAMENNWDFVPESFNVTGLDKFVSSYYQLRYGDSRFEKEIHGAPMYGAWKQSMEANINLDSDETQTQTKDIHQNIMDQLQ
jgi:hypothetical protein